MKKTIILLAVFALLLNSYTSKAGCDNPYGYNPYCENYGSPGLESQSWDLSSAFFGLHLYMGGYGDAYSYGNWSSLGTSSCYYTSGGMYSTTVDDYFVQDGLITLGAYSADTSSSAFIAASW